MTTLTVEIKNKRQKKDVGKMFGKSVVLLRKQGLTLQAIGDFIGTTKERVRQIEAKALEEILREKIYVVEDENYICIVGTNNRLRAKNELAKAEVTWYGENFTDPELDFEQFGLDT